MPVASLAAHDFGPLCDAIQLFHAGSPGPVMQPYYSKGTGVLNELFVTSTYRSKGRRRPGHGIFPGGGTYNYGVVDFPLVSSGRDVAIDKFTDK